MRVVSRARIWGSSPLTRGKRAEAAVGCADLGIIPAHAGKTGFAVVDDEAARDHPRSRGENDLIRVAGYLSVGSSPLTRGKRSQ